MAGEALAMVDTDTANSRTRCAYDHRIRDQVVRSGTRYLPKHIRIPRSTASTWRRRGSRPVVTIEPIDQDRQQLVDTIAKLDRRVPRLELVRRCRLRRKSMGQRACRRSCRLGCDILRIEPSHDVEAKGGNKAAPARALGINRRKLYRKLS
jgi:hypothetical protein